MGRRTGHHARFFFLVKGLVMKWTVERLDARFGPGRRPGPGRAASEAEVIQADELEIVAGTLIFRVDGQVTRAFSSGSWGSVEAQVEPEEPVEPPASGQVVSGEVTEG